MRKIFVDLDNTLCTTIGVDYKNSTPKANRIELINKLYENGDIITIYTARGSGSGINYKDLTLNHEKFKDILKETKIVNINISNANNEIISIQKTDDKNSSDTSLIDSDSSDDVDDEVKELLLKTDSQLLKEKKEILLTVIGRLKLYKKGYEKKKKADLVSIIRSFK